MPTKITKRTIDEALRTAGRVRLTDTQKGLMLRTRSGAAVWSYRMQRDGRQVFVDLGTHLDINPDQARMLAAEASDLIRRGGRPDDEWVARRRVGLGVDETVVARSTKPTLAQVRGDFLLWILGNRRPKTHADYRQTLTQPALARLMDQHIDRLEREDFAEAIAAMAATGRFRNAEKTGHILSAMWSWASQDHLIRKTGATRGMLIGLKPPETQIVKKPRRVPSPATVRTLLAMRKDMSPTIADAVTLLAYTAQRRLTIVSARREDFQRTGQYLVWTIPGPKMKAGREHAIPLPREIWLIVERVEKGFLFPSGAGHVSEYTLTHALCDRPVGFSPHDLRRGFSQLVRAKGFTTADVKLVLDHSEGAGDDVTLAHYDFFADMRRKHAILRAWADALKDKAKQGRARAA
ncbi:MAG TPA: DUF4102 domain-containing protein [Aurantimonas coralicida]|uniref:DUF4102 domain-containing protein n=2 Tax=root TaxID=1 RepID=A0A9C9NCX7_9HYPH|nr:DUF4102 domain-containing protein [Aurantimonas coralicida]HET99300.1 DUF4102 domain-containing protein [Aurantimonas coralicida]